MRITVVVPALNEAVALPTTLRSLFAQTRTADRVVVVDGGSADDTVAVARQVGAETLVVPGRGRGGQVAAGVAACSEEVIVVAHADMLFPPDALAAVESFLVRRPDCPGGCLGHRFDRPGWAYRAIEWWDRRRAIRGYGYGDQGQFFRRDVLEFPDLPIMEDVELARRLRRLGRPVYLDRPVTVSARRYERQGWLRVMWDNWMIRRAYESEGPAAAGRLYERYYRSRPPRKPAMAGLR
ncbi:MAG TPA: glycosyltransferase, partial [Gemmataceae bacterium]|nr:glycosyltransferase [Gemmataceae bacterium]